MKKIIEDCYKFFTTQEGVDILPYAYLQSGKQFENLIKNCKSYYLFNDEIELIRSNSQKLSYYLQNAEDIIEIGPGSEHSVINKTLPILKNVKKMTNYYPIDLSEEYLIKTRDIVLHNLPYINVIPKNINIMQASIKDDFHINKSNKNRAFIFLGGTLGNFNTRQQKSFLKKIHDVLNKNDLFLITVDTNTDRNVLEKAYNNDYLREIFYNSLKYFEQFYSGSGYYADKFDVCIEYNKHKRYINLFCTAQENLTIYLPDYGRLEIKKGQKLQGIKSRKFTETEFINLLKTHHISTIFILNNSDKMRLFICRREN